MEAAKVPEKLKPATDDAATGMDRRASRGERGQARVDRSVEEPGRPGSVVGEAIDAAREFITVWRLSRESDGSVVAKKRVTTVERRGPVVSVLR